MPTLMAPAPPAPVAPLHSFLTLDQLGPRGLRALLDLTGRLKRDPDAFRNQLAGGRLGMLFDKPPQFRKVLGSDARRVAAPRGIRLKATRAANAGNESNDGRAAYGKLFSDHFVGAASAQVLFDNSLPKIV